jgi:hypothetical protein
LFERILVHRNNIIDVFENGFLNLSIIVFRNHFGILFERILMKGSVEYFCYIDILTGATEGGPQIHIL